MMNENIVIFGIDPGLQKTGWGIISSINGKQSYILSGVIKTITSTDLSIRLHKIFCEIRDLIHIHSPREIALEETYVNTNAKSSLHLSHARAAAILAAAEHGLQVKHYQAKTVKKVVTGSGNADKEQMSKMLKLRIKGIENIHDKDAIDAIALAFCHAQYAR